MYEISAGETVLRLLTRENLVDLRELYENRELVKGTLLYGGFFNLSYSPALLETFLALEEFAANNRFYLLEESIGERVWGICGLFDIHWIQRRAELVFLAGASERKQKKSYAPLKALLKLACGQWGLHLLTCKIFTADTATLTVLKGYGFQVAGEIKEYGRDGNEMFDVTLLTLKAAEFRSVEV